MYSSRNSLNSLTRAFICASLAVPLAGEGAFGGDGDTLAGEGAFGGDGDTLAGDSLAGDSLAGDSLAGDSLAGEGAFGGGGGGALGVTLVDPQRKRMSGYITDAAASALFMSSFSQSR